MLNDYLVTLIKQNLSNGISTLPSENSLAIRFGVSRTSIRKALADLEREGLIFRVRGKGCFIHDGGKLSDLENGVFEKIFAFICPETRTVFVSEIKEGIKGFCNENGILLLTLPSDFSASKEIENLHFARRAGAQGLIIMPTIDYEHHSEVLAPQINKLPIVFVDTKPKGLNGVCVSSKHFDMGLLAANYLKKQNCKRIAIICSSNIGSVKSRIEGYISALGDEKPIIIHDIGHYDGQDLTNYLKDKLQNVDGIISQSGTHAAQIIYAMSQLNKTIFDDYQMVVFDNDCDLIDLMLPRPVPAVMQQAYKIGHRAAQMLSYSISSNFMSPFTNTFFDVKMRV